MNIRLFSGQVFIRKVSFKKQNGRIGYPAGTIHCQHDIFSGGHAICHFFFGAGLTAAAYLSIAAAIELTMLS